MKLKLIHGDCLEEMKKLPDRSIDLFLCDLPYGCLSVPRTQKWMEQYGRTEDGSLGGCQWDVKINLEKFWEEVERLMKDDHTPIIHFCNTRFGYELIKSKENWFRYDLVWNKMRGVSFLSANKMPMKSHEMIYVFSKKGAKYNRVDIEGEFVKSHSRGNAIHGTTNTYNGGRPLPIVELKDNRNTRCVLSVIDMPNDKKKGNHPTQKPIDIYKWLIERYSNPGDTILDATAGSFTSCKAALECGRQAIGIEKDEKFYNKAVSSFQS